MTSITSLELCAGAGGQALGLERAGIKHACLMEIDRDACSTLRLNRPKWLVSEADLTTFNGRTWRGVDLVTGGLPCPPYSIAGKQLGPQDERDLFGHGLRIIDEVRPMGVLIENVKGILAPRFEEVRLDLKKKLKKLGYEVQWRLLNASDFGVPQLRPRVLFVGLPAYVMDFFEWPTPSLHPAPNVGDILFDLMAANGWKGVEAWSSICNDIAPTLVGGSKKHGGPDLGPTRAKKAWEMLGVNGKSIAEEAPFPDFTGLPRLTVRMAARLQGFPDTWQFHGRKTTAYRQVANAFPPPVAQAVAKQIRLAIEKASRNRLHKQALPIQQDILPL